MKHFAMNHFLLLFILSHCSIYSLPIKLGGETLPDAGLTQDLNLISDAILSKSDVIGTDVEELQSAIKRRDDFLQKRSNYVVDIKNMDADKDISSISHASLESWGQFDEIDYSNRRRELPLEVHQAYHHWERPPLMFEMDEDAESSRGVQPSDFTVGTSSGNSDVQSGSYSSGRRDSRRGLDRVQSINNNGPPARIGIPSGLLGQEMSEGGIGYLPHYLTQSPSKRPNELPAGGHSHTSTESEQLMFEMDDMGGEAELSSGVKANDFTARASSGNSNGPTKSSYEVSDSIRDNDSNGKTDSRGNLKGAQESTNNELPARIGFLGNEDDLSVHLMQSHNDVEEKQHPKKSELSRLMEEMALQDPEESLLQYPVNSAAKPNILPADGIRPLELKRSNNVDAKDLGSQKLPTRSELSRFLQQVAIQGPSRTNSFQDSLKLLTLPPKTKR
jgi:hypothetical protein